MRPDHGHEYDLVLPFDTDDPEFARGVEVGLMCAEAQFGQFTGGAHYSRTIHGNNAEMALRVAEKFGLVCHSEELGDDWLRVTFTELEGGEG